MLNRLSDFLLGWREMRVRESDRVWVMDTVYRFRFGLRRQVMEEDGGIRFRLRKREADRLGILAKEQGCEIEVTDEGGIPTVVQFLLMRPMIPLGCLLLFGWMFYSEGLIWDVRVEGNTKTPTSEILSRLEEMGCCVGDRWGDIDFDVLHARYAAEQKDLAWLSVYRNGTVAEVQVRELWRDERPNHEANTYANIVASCDGIVEDIRVFQGQAAVQAGDLVRAGQVLISGVIENKDGSARFQYAAGEVRCTTTVPLSVSVETKREVRRLTGEEISRKSIKIFKKTINLFGKGRIAYPDCDKIYKMEQLCPFGLVTLPVWFSETVYREAETVREEVSVEDAAAEALRLLSEKIRQATENAQLTERLIETEVSDGICRISCTLILSKDIGTVEEFTAWTEEGELHPNS